MNNINDEKYIVKAYFDQFLCIRKLSSLIPLFINIFNAIIMSTNTRNIWCEITFDKLAKFWLVCILLFLPFQRKLIGALASLNYSKFSYIAYLDEITIAVFALFAIRKFYKEKETFKQEYFILLLPIVLLSITGLVSGSINGNSLIITGLGTIDYIKNFLAIFIYAAFFKNPDDFKKIFRYLLLLTVLLGMVSFAQEVWALFSRYIMGKDIMDIMYILTRNSMPENSWRFGIYRAPSILTNANSVAFYSLLIFSIYLVTSKKTNYVFIFAMLSGIIFSGSKRGCVALIVFAVLVLLKRRKVLVSLVISIIILCVSYTFWDLDMSKSNSNVQFTELNNKLLDDEIVSDTEVTGFFREYTKKKALEIWKDHPMLGVGPGKFGGIISIKTHSSIYEEYHLSNVINYIRKWSGIDQYWPQVLAETGIVGVLMFTGSFIILSLVLFMGSQMTSHYELKGLFIGLLIYLPAIFIKTLGSGLNSAIMLFTYFAFAGMALGCGEEFKKKC